LSEKVRFMEDGKPGTWQDGRLDNPGSVEHHSSLVDYTTADVRDSSGTVHEDVTIIPPDSNPRR